MYRLVVRCLLVFSMLVFLTSYLFYEVYPEDDFSLIFKIEKTKKHEQTENNQIDQPTQTNLLELKSIIPNQNKLTLFTNSLLGIVFKEKNLIKRLPIAFP